MDKKLLKKLAKWHESDEYQKIVDTILVIPEKERDYDLTGQLARALNNLEDYETAAEILLTVEEEGKNDPLWHYRLGYAYYYSQRFEQAKERFEQVLRMKPNDEDAEMFIGWCEKELDPKAREKELNQRLMAPEAILGGETFRQRTVAFWDWFTRNEPKLAEMIKKRGEQDTDKMIEFISEGVRLVSEEVNFNVGGNYEFTFAVEGNNYLFYLLPWLVTHMPEEFRTKWHFFSCMQGTSGNSFGFRMYGKDIQLSEVMVGLKYDKEQNYFNIRFFDKQLCSLEENQCYNAFCIMMELAIGEAMSHIYINNVDKAEYLEDGMFPLTKLESCIMVALEDVGKEIMTRPDERYTVYKMKFEENKDLRYDMVIGTTCFTELVRDYFNEETTNVDKLDACGAKAFFLVMPMGEVDRSEMLKLRYEIEDRLTAEVLGDKGSGQEIGILLGGAMGQDNLYIDILLYDTPAFLTKAMDWLKQYPYPFYLSEFRPESRLVAMANVEAELPGIPVKESELARQMMEYMDCPCEWFAPMADAEPLDKAYFEALQRGKKEGFIPVLVVVDDTLMECLAMNADEENEPDYELENVRTYRRRMLEETEIPDARTYFEELKDERQEELEDEEQWQELMGEMNEGHPNNDLAGYWNYDTRLTNEVLLVKIPVDQPWKIFAWLPMGNWNECPDTPLLMSVAKYWYETYGAVPSLMTHDVLEFYVEKPMEDAEQAMKLALEHYTLCPDCVEQCGDDDTVGKRADSLRQSTVWYFWWD